MCNYKLYIEILFCLKAESEVAALNRKVQMIEEDLERSEERSQAAASKLAEASQAADESQRYFCAIIYLIYIY